MIVVPQLIIIVLFIALSINLTNSIGNFNDIIPSIKQFSAEFYQLATSDDDTGNVVCSPLSLYVSLAMMTYATGGRSKAQILTAMHLTEIIEHDYGRNFRHLIPAMSPPIRAKLVLANKLFLNNNISMKIHFIRALGFFFRNTYQYQTINFDNPRQVAVEVNNWCDQQTDQRITDVVTADDIEEALMILINAVYFKGSWTKQFSTSKKPFHVNEDKIVVTTLTLSDRFNVRTHNDLDAQSIELKYGTSAIDSFSMFIIRPNKIDGLDKIEKNLHKLDLSENVDVQELHLRLQFPKFNIKSEFDLVPLMKSMGVVDIFDKDKANFTQLKVDEPLNVHKLKQHAVINVDEYGTDVNFGPRLAVRQTAGMKFESFVVDRPFFYTIAMRESGVPVMYGRVTDPSN